VCVWGGGGRETAEAWVPRARSLSDGRQSGRETGLLTKPLLVSLDHSS
jgi:hypothetical protein